MFSTIIRLQNIFAIFPFKRVPFIGHDSYTVLLCEREESVALQGWRLIVKLKEGRDKARQIQKAYNAQGLAQQPWEWRLLGFKVNARKEACRCIVYFALTRITRTHMQTYISTPLPTEVIGTPTSAGLFVCDTKPTKAAVPPVCVCVWANSHVHIHSSYRNNSCTYTQRINIPQLCLSVQTSLELAGQLAVRNDLRPSEKKDSGQSWGESLWLAPLLEVFWASLAPKKGRLMNPSKLGPNFVWTTN